VILYYLAHLLPELEKSTDQRGIGMGASQNYIGTKKKTLKLSDISWMHSPDLHCWRCLGFLIFVASKKYKKMDGTKLAQHVHPKQ